MPVPPVTLSPAQLATLRAAIDLDRRNGGYRNTQEALHGLLDNPANDLNGIRTAIQNEHWAHGSQGEIGSVHHYLAKMNEHLTVDVMTKFHPVAAARAAASQDVSNFTFTNGIRTSVSASDALKFPVQGEAVAKELGMLLHERGVSPFSIEKEGGWHVAASQEALAAAGITSDEVGRLTTQAQAQLANEPARVASITSGRETSVPMPVDSSVKFPVHGEAVAKLLGRALYDKGIENVLFAQEPDGSWYVATRMDELTAAGVTSDEVRVLTIREQAELAGNPAFVASITEGRETSVPAPTAPKPIPTKTPDNLGLVITPQEATGTTSPDRLDGRHPGDLTVQFKCTNETAHADSNDSRSGKISPEAMRGAVQQYFDERGISLRGLTITTQQGGGIRTSWR